MTSQYNHYHNKRPRYRKGSAFNPTAAQRENAIDEYMYDYPDVTASQAASIIDELFKDWVEEHA